MSEESQTVDDLYNDEPAAAAPDTGAAPVIEPHTPAAEPPAPAAAAPEPPAGEAAPAPDAPDLDDRPGLERYLAEYGIEGGMIQFEDGEKVHIDELSSEEQHVVLNNLATKSRPTIEQQNDLNEEEIQFLNMLRESGKPVEDLIAGLANSQLDRIRNFEESQSVDWDNMGEDAVYLAFLREKNPEMSNEDLQDDLDKAKETQTFSTVVKGIKEDFKAAQVRFAQDAENQQSEQFNAEMEVDRKIIVETVAPIKEVAGFNISDDQKNALLGDMLELNDVGDSILLERIFSNPQNILEAAWFQKYGRDSISQMENYYKQELSKAYGRGRDEALGKMPESNIPARIGGLGTRADLKNNDGFGAKPDAQNVDDLYND